MTAAANGFDGEFELSGTKEAEVKFYQHHCPKPHAHAGLKRESQNARHPGHRQAGVSAVLREKPI